MEIAERVVRRHVEEAAGRQVVQPDHGLVELERRAHLRIQRQRRLHFQQLRLAQRQRGIPAQAPGELPLRILQLPDPILGPLPQALLQAGADGRPIVVDQQVAQHRDLVTVQGDEGADQGGPAVEGIFHLLAQHAQAVQEGRGTGQQGQRTQDRNHGHQAPLGVDQHRHATRGGRTAAPRPGSCCSRWQPCY
ncbi:hypothetical protein D3C78_1426360 [compost metagenome]